MQLNPRRYNWKSNGASDIGFIAQELEQVIPEVVFGENGSKTISYGQLGALSIKGLQDIGLRIDLLSAPTSAPSLKLDESGRLIVNNNFTVQNDATIGSLNVTDEAIFDNGITVLSSATSSFGGALLVEGTLSLAAGDITITTNGINSENPFAINESQLYVATTGFVGIGTSTPERMLHVVRGDAGSPVRFQDANGYCEINPTTASLICTSDETLKENINDIASAPIMEKMRELRPVNFEWITDDSDAEQVGFIAQEVELVFPELVYTDEETGLKSVAYGGFVPYIVATLQEIMTKIDTLAGRVDTLFTQMESLANRSYGAAVGAFQKLSVGSSAQPGGITIYDEETGDPYCMTVRNGSIVTRFGQCGTPIEDVTQTHEQHVLEDSSAVGSGETVDPDELLNAPTTTPSTTPAVVPEVVEEEPLEPEPEVVAEPVTEPEPEPEVVEESTPAPTPAPTPTPTPEPAPVVTPPVTEPSPPPSV